jgi:hypothetical protein
MVRASKDSVSGPGKLSKRTDLTPAGGGGSNQPVQVPTGQAYGNRQAAEQAQGSAPMQGGGGAPPGLMGGAFGPTTRPDESLEQASPAGAAPMPEGDPDLLLRALFKMNPNADLERMLLRRRPRY